jgi:hypothetical protein
MTESEFLVVGMKPNPGGTPFALLARQEEGALVYAGSAFVTLPANARDKFWNAAEKLKVDQPGFAEFEDGQAQGGLRCAEAAGARPPHASGRVLRHASLTELLR